MRGKPAPPTAKQSAMRLCLGVLVLGFAWTARAQPDTTIPAAEIGMAPSADRVRAAVHAGETGGWSREAAALRLAAFASYETGDLQAAKAWLNLSRWAQLLGEPETVAVLDWIHSVETAKLAHANLPRNYAMRRGVSLAVWLSPSSRGALAGDAAFLDAFFAQLTPYDYLPRVLEILSRLHDADPAAFADYRNLAIAIALVYDTPPPPWWPHAQVAPDMLKRAWPDPLAAFQFFVAQDRTGKCLQPLRRLAPDELKFVVDVAAPFDELRWSQSVVELPLDRLDRAYSMIRYRVDRLRNGRAVWPEPSYSLPRILGYGGICVDQAYFACEVGKARGVPTLLFQGAGLDGRHAWFGYLGPGQAWRLDVGRYAEQRLVTGAAIDPQTWGWLTDHDVRFLAERFQTLESTRRSRIYSDFAAAFAAAGDSDRARQAAEDALRAESRNLEAWQILVEISRERHEAAEATETVLRRAMHAFQKYPDLEARFTEQLVESLRARGETSMADFERASFIRKFGGRREDLAIREAAVALVQTFGTADLAAQIGLYNRTVDRFADTGGAALFDGVVRVFVEHLLEIGRPREALQALGRARSSMHVAAGTPLAGEIDGLELRARGHP